jgi:NitT/TauT family transport system permease protein
MVSQVLALLIAGAVMVQLLQPAGAKLLQLLGRYERLALGVGSMAVLLASWELASRWEIVDPRFASSPFLVVRATGAAIASGELWFHGRVTLLEFAAGFSVAVVVGLALGTVAGWSKRAGQLVDPFLMALSSTPRSALIPILIVWFGLGFGSKAVLVFLNSIIPIVIDTMIGVRAADPQLRQVARSFGASRAAEIVYVVLPGALPHIFAGLRIGLNLALIGVIIAEMYVAIAGMGRMIVVFGGAFRIDELLSYIFVVSVFGGLFVMVLGLIERALVPWHEGS